MIFEQAVHPLAWKSFLQTKMPHPAIRSNVPEAETVIIKPNAAVMVALHSATRQIVCENISEGWGFDSPMPVSCLSQGSTSAGPQAAVFKDREKRDRPGKF